MLKCTSFSYVLLRLREDKGLVLSFYTFSYVLLRLKPRLAVPSSAPASTPEEMARQDVEAVREIVRPCGLSERKASAIVNLSRILVEKYEGKVPCDFAALESLPGVGHKTASVVMVQAFGVPAFPVDTHIFRLSRLWGLSTGKTVETVERDLKSLFPEKSWGDLHLRIVLYGREYCPARGCGGRCPICSRLARESGCEGV